MKIGRDEIMNTDRTFGEPVGDIITRRKSVRTYTGAPVLPEVQEKIEAYAANAQGPFGVKTRLVLLDKPQVKSDEKIRLGTYGVIAGANLYMAGVVEQKERAMEELGYALESVILYMTHLGLGTCWLAGTFNKGEFKKAADMQSNELLPIVTPVGYESGIKTPIDILFKQPWRKERKNWKEIFFQDTFETPLSRAGAGPFDTVLEMVRLAPSASNRQPWRVVKTGDDYHFYIVHTPGYDRVYGYDIQKVDMGIAMCHWELAAKEAGLGGKWEDRDPGLVKAGAVEYIATWAGK